MEAPMHYPRPLTQPSSTNLKLIPTQQIRTSTDLEVPKPTIKPKTSISRKILDHLRRPRVHTALALSDEKEKNKLRDRRLLAVSTSSTLSLGEMKSQVDAEPYLWPHDGSLDRKTTALVIIDMQKDFCSPDGYLQHQGYDISPAREIIPRLQTLLSAFRAHNFPIYHTREGHRPDLSTLSSRELHRSRNNPSKLGIGDVGPLGRLLVRGEPGHAIIPELEPLPNEQIIDKPGRSAFQHTEFQLMLGIKGISNLVICGVTTDVCVTSTMREANDNGFDCLLVGDACAASERSLHDAAVEMVKTEGGIFGAVTSTERVLAALSGQRVDG